MNKLWVRLSLAFSAVVLVAVLIVLLTSFVIEFFDDDRDRFTIRFLRESHGLVDTLADYYQSQQSWDGVEPMLVGAQAVYLRPNRAFFLADSDQRIIYNGQPDTVGQSVAHSKDLLLVPIELDQQTVGFLGLARTPERDANSGRPFPFVGILVNVLLIIAAVGGIGGIIFGVVMSRSLTAPLNNLTEAARAIGARHLSRRVEEQGSDELIEVARAFNDMAADLEEAEKLRQNLLADVAHELRTPLTVLQGNLQAILDDVYPLNKEEIAHLHGHTRLLGRLVNDLHELAQAEANQLPLDLQETDLTQLIGQISDAFRPSAEAKGVTLKTELAAGVPLIRLDAARIRQVLQNLLNNGLRHTPQGGIMTIRLSANLEIIRIDIADTGDGIPSEHLPHIFDRFYRTDPARTRDQGGAGLGLAIARAIVEAHRGMIEATSAGVPGQGTTFTIRFPIAAEM